MVSSEIGSSGGIERVFLELILFFAKQGYKVNVVCRSIDASLVPYLNHLEILDVPRGRNLLGRLYCTLLWMLHASHTVKKLAGNKGVVIGPPCSVFHVDIVMAGSCHLAALLEEYKEGKRIWLLNPMNWLIVASEKYAFTRSHATIMVPSIRTGQEIHRLYGVPESRLEVIPHGVDVNVFRPVESAKNKLDSRKKFGLPTDQLVLLSIANELERKGCYLVLEALALTQAQGFDIHYVIAGRSDYIRFRAMAEAKGLALSITLLPPTKDDDLVALYQTADIFALPTKYESFGLVCMEALACGLPVISCAVGGVEDYVSPGLDGWLVARNPQAIAEGLVAASKLECREIMSTQSRLKACQYEWREVLKPLNGIVERYL